MDFDHRRADRCRSLDLGRLGGNEQRDANAGAGEFVRPPRARLRAGRRRRGRPRWYAPARRSGTMQAACGRSLRAIATISGVAAISRLSGLFDVRLEPHDVVVDDVAAILAQMGGDAVGAGGDRDLGGLHRIGMPAAARVAHGGDVIDVDAEADGSDGGHADRSRERRRFSRSRARRWRPPSSRAIAR